jgi:hypothetical protein
MQSFNSNFVKIHFLSHKYKILDQRYRTLEEKYNYVLRRKNYYFSNAKNSEENQKRSIKCEEICSTFVQTFKDIDKERDSILKEYRTLKLEFPYMEEDLIQDPAYATCGGGGGGGYKPDSEIKNQKLEDLVDKLIKNDE